MCKKWLRVRGDTVDRGNERRVQNVQRTTESMVLCKGMSPRAKIRKGLSTAEILQELDAATVKEELALPVYASHIKSVLFWSGLSKEKQESICQSLEILLQDSAGHVQLLKHIKMLYLKEVRTR